jgi:serine/threonine protein kinase
LLEDQAELAWKSYVTPQQLANTIKELSDNILSFDDDKFRHVRVLQDAPRNKGQVHHMEMLDGNFAYAVAVKSMPRSWMQRSHCEFRKKRPNERELPWIDIGIVQELNSRQYHYSCDLMGVFEMDDRLLIVTSLAEHGDLFAWSSCQLACTGDRGRRIQPVAAQLFDAVCWLHELGIAHRDISLENCVLTGNVQVPELKLIDFGMAVVARHTQGNDHGKNPYKAPEMHTQHDYDGFLSDTFATGVVVLSMALVGYPWETTRPGKDPKFTKATLVGMSSCLESMTTRLPGGDTVALSQVASSEMIELLVGLLALQPCGRLTLGESCFMTQFSVWNGPWLRGLRPNHGVRVESCGNTPTASTLENRLNNEVTVRGRSRSLPVP